MSDTPADAPVVVDSHSRRRPRRPAKRRPIDVPVPGEVREQGLLNLETGEVEPIYVRVIRTRTAHR